MSSQNRQCNVCYTAQEQICFLRNSKFYKSCNNCSAKLHNKYLDGKTTKRTKEEQQLYNSIYYLKNRDKIIISTLATNAKRNEEMFACECGAIVKLASKYKHFKTKKHGERMALKSASIE